MKGVAAGLFLGRGFSINGGEAQDPEPYFLLIAFLKTVMGLALRRGVCGAHALQ